MPPNESNERLVATDVRRVDAEFIAAAREAVPVLRQRVLEMEAALVATARVDQKLLNECTAKTDRLRAALSGLLEHVGCVGGGVGTGVPLAWDPCGARAVVAAKKALEEEKPVEQKEHLDHDFEERLLDGLVRALLYFKDSPTDERTRREVFRMALTFAGLPAIHAALRELVESDEALDHAVTTGANVLPQGNRRREALARAKGVLR